ncbi:hypothetical protein K438DRAFT_1904106 [Mycena galopus ATCC 62051]|nr:hypothetical protein K438DRAFT_1904106 [Mycena galopus ATCC 62051]
MPVAIPTFGSFEYVTETKVIPSTNRGSNRRQENLPWADLVTLDLSLYATPKGRKVLARSLITAVREKGFFYVKNFGVSLDAVNRQFAIGKAFYDLPLEEKLKYVADNFDNGGFNGYMPAGRVIVDPNTGLKDKVEVYNIPKFNGDFTHGHPPPVACNLGEIEEFVRDLQTKVVEPLLTLRFSSWVPGHTDLGSFTLLFRQPEWKWVKPQNATLTGGYVRSTIHRVMPPPKDQQHVDRLGLLYFSRPHNDVKLATIQDSPVLQREGYIKNPFEASGNPVPTMEEWTFAKQKWQRTGYLGPQRASKEVLPGFPEKLYT